MILLCYGPGAGPAGGRPHARPAAAAEGAVV